MIREVQPANKLEGRLNLPPDKSISHRSAMFAAISEGESVIENYSEAADPQSTLSCLRQLGVSIREQAGMLRIRGAGRDGLIAPDEDLDCGNSGTTMRLLSGIVGGAGISCRLTGDESLSARTMKRIIDPLNKMGISIDGRDGIYAPLAMSREKPLQPLEFELPIPSAQLKSCVLLAGLFGDDETRVIETTPSRDHTERLLQLPREKSGSNTVISSHRGHVIPEQNYRIPNDFSAAAFWLVAGSIHPQSSILLEGVGTNPTRTAALHLLQRMGADIERHNERTEGSEPVSDIEVASSSLKPVEVDEELVPNCIDELPVLAVAMLFAEGTSKIRGAAELRHKETDRLSALADLLARAGAQFEEFEDGMDIHGDPGFRPKPASYESYHDHRIAMSAAVLSLMSARPSSVKGAECTAISYPGFWDDMNKLTN